MKKVVIIVIAIIIALGGSLGYFYYKSHKENNNVVENTPEPVEEIDKFGYELEDRDTILFMDTFNEMKEVLSFETIDYSKYAELLSKLYIIDLYTISNKISKYDVGGSDYVYPSKRDNFELKVRDTLYKFVEDNSNLTRNQDLPEVKNIETESIEETKYKIDTNEYNAYKVSLKWDYIKEEEYDKSALIYLINDNDILYVVEQKIVK